jgi:GNAT superfamily N-acetyltransferase
MQSERRKISKQIQGSMETDDVWLSSGVHGSRSEKAENMANDSIRIRPMQPEKIRAVSDLVFRSFKSNVAPYYSGEGVETFFDYADPGALAERFQKDHFVLVALEGPALVGMIEIRNNRHISLLFVEPLQQQKGIGKGLLARAIFLARQNDPELKELTVNSSPNSVEAYKRFGFTPSASFQEKTGFSFCPCCWPGRISGRKKGPEPNGFRVTLFLKRAL